MATVQYYGTGKRKSSTARVYLLPGIGDIKVNKRELADYFRNETQRTVIRSPLTITDNLGKFDLRITVDGGGISGQAGAIRLGIAKALLEFNTELRPRLKRAGHADARFPHQGTEEIRTKGSSQEIPVLQAVT